MRQGFLWVGLTAAAFALVTLAAASGASAQEARVRLEVPPGVIGVEDPPFTVDVVVEDIVNIGGFQFDLHFDPSVLTFVNVEMGPFLGSSGRRVECLDPRVGPEYVQFVCVTLGALPPGADGSGVLATVTFDPASPGTSPLRLERVIIARLDGERIPATDEDGSISVALPPGPETPAPADTPPGATPTDLTPTVVTPAEATPVTATPVRATATASPATTSAPENGGTNWSLWGSVIGGAAILVVAAASVAWWSKARKVP